MGRLQLAHGSEQLREAGVLEVSAVAVPVELSLQALGHGLLLAPGQERVVRGAELHDLSAVPPDPLPVPRPAEVPWTVPHQESVTAGATRFYAECFIRSDPFPSVTGQPSTFI